jgi:hypothetical protein
MIVDRISDLLNASPFRPFRIRTGDAKSIPVLHPEVVFITPSRDTVIVTKEQGGFFILEPQVITQAETVKDGNDLEELKREAGRA